MKIGHVDDDTLKSYMLKGPVSNSARTHIAEGKVAETVIQTLQPTWK